MCVFFVHHLSVEPESVHSMSAYAYILQYSLRVDIGKMRIKKNDFCRGLDGILSLLMVSGEIYVEKEFLSILSL